MILSEQPINLQGFNGDFGLTKISKGELNTFNLASQTMLR
jgi:hypothetical protein